jgi:hypothetical protein
MTLGLWVAIAGLAQAQQVWSYADLVARMTDVRQLSVLPQAGETCRQWSSWDRHSQFDAATGKYVNWDANGDGHGCIRKEGEQMVMAEMTGPGCIWRTWSARAQSGHVKIYLDGQEQPVIDLPFQDYFSGNKKPFDYPQLSYDLNTMGCSGQNLYFPIPYQKSCKIVADPDWGAYYQFVYTTYPAGTQVPTFSAALAAQHSEQLQKVNDYFASGLGSQSPAAVANSETIDEEVTVQPGETAGMTLDGPRAIVCLRAIADFADRADEMAALRKMVLKITWDNQAAPAVWCPLGDFCGTAPGVNFYRSLMTGITEEGAYANWYMPFEKSARIEVLNEDSTARTFRFQVTHAPLERPFAGLGYFHCKWHRDLESLPDDRWPDWLLLRTQGRGRFCGVMLHVWNPRGGWWGEGDEKFFVDGEKYPSTFGTGSEDYFGYAWCHPGLFQRAYHGQTMTMRNQGHQSVFRWHVTDNIPFQTAFEGCIEKYYRLEEKGTKYAVTVAWYLSPDGTDPYTAVPADQRHDYYDSPPIVAGGYRVVGTPPGFVQTQGLRDSHGGWQDNDQLWWTDAKPGDKLQIVLHVPEAGDYDVSGVFTKARDYGIVQLSLDGQKLGEPLDLYNPTVVPTAPLPLGRHHLDAGDQVLTVEITGANEQAVKSYMFGLDRIVLEKAK